MRRFIKMVVAICATGVLSACALGKDVGGDDSLPRVWCSYSKIANEKDEAADLKAHGVDVVGYGCQSIERVREHLAAERRVKELKRYRWIVSPEPYPGAILVGAGEAGKELRTREYLAAREVFRKLINEHLK